MRTFSPLMSKSALVMSHKHNRSPSHLKAYGGAPSPGYGVQDILDKYAADGWELAAPLYVGKNAAGSTGEIYLIFRK